MAVKLIEIIPDSGALGTQVINFSDARAGLRFSQTHVRPTSPRRVQNGDLIVQTIRYNKKEFSVSIGLHDIPIKTYLESLYESGVGATFKVWYQDSTSYVDTTEFNGSVQMLDLSEDMDQSGNVRTLTAIFSEV